MFINIKPLAKYRDYRLLFIGQSVSFLGSMASYVVIPYQVYELTHSSLYVGMLSTVQLLPILFFGLLGGSVADSMDRRKLMLYSELALSFCVAILAVNAAQPQPSVFLIFAICFIMQAVNGFHRPAMEAMTQKLVTPQDYAAVSALSHFRHSFGAVFGPALGGILMAKSGAVSAYIFDFVTFAVAVIAIYKMYPSPAARQGNKTNYSNVIDGLKFAWTKPELLGTYFVDIVAMTFAFSTALFPAMSQKWGGAEVSGMLFSAMSVGSLAVTVVSGWSGKVRRHGRAVVVSAALWGAAMIGFGAAESLWMALLFLGIAGAADMVSGLFRGIIWNETIPNEMRGRLAGVEMISYMTGPLLGNSRAGWMATWTSNAISLVSGGILCVIGVATTGFFLPAFWKYKSVVNEPKTPATS